jgi:hypothetical protein
MFVLVMHLQLCPARLRKRMQRCSISQRLYMVLTASHSTKAKSRTLENTRIRGTGQKLNYIQLLDLSLLYEYRQQTLETKR